MAAGVTVATEALFTRPGSGSIAAAAQDSAAQDARIDRAEATSSGNEGAGGGEGGGVQSLSGRLTDLTSELF